MNSLFTSTFSPVAFSLGLLLLVATAFPAPAPLGEDSEDNITSNRAPLTSLNQTEKLIKSIFFEISKVRNKMCGTDDTCKNVMEALAGNNLNLPKMAEKDGCFQAGFNQEPCLMKITTGLLEFQIYLEFLKDNYKENAVAMQRTTKALFHNLKQMIKNPDEVTTPDPIADSSLLAQMQSQTEWLRNTTVRLILQSLEMFLQYTHRAVRLM